METLRAEAATEEALTVWTTDEALQRVDTRWTPRLMERLAGAVRGVLARDPRAAKRSGLVRMARAILRGDEAVRCRLGRDPAMGRWIAALESALSRGDVLDPWLAIAPRFEVAAALIAGADLETSIVLGSGGRARLPGDGRVLQGPPGRSLRVAVRRGELRTHARDSRQAGLFEVVDGDAEAGTVPEVEPLSGGSLPDIVRPLEAGAECLRTTAPALAAEAAALAPVLVAVGGSPDVSHSASLAEARGCIWLTPVARPLVVAETLVHEASHLKFFLVEDVAPLVVWPDPPRFEVPWRADRRPLRAVLMGLHAWVRVLQWSDGLAGGPLAQPAAERGSVLRDAVRAAATIVSGADGLTPAGEGLVTELCRLAVDR